jgi:hypothetical protein
MSIAGDDWMAGNFDKHRVPGNACKVSKGKVQSTPGPSGYNEFTEPWNQPIAGQPLTYWKEVYHPGVKFEQFILGTTIYNANVNQAKQVAHAHELGALLIAAALKHLGKPDAHKDSLAHAYFGGPKAKGEAVTETTVHTLLKYFKKIRKDFVFTKYWVSPYDLSPEEKCHFVYSRGHPYAYTYFKDKPKPIELCWNKFFKETLEKEAKTLVHEQAHWSNDADDNAYKWDTESFEKLTQKQQLSNADSFGFFALDAYLLEADKTKKAKKK